MIPKSGNCNKKCYSARVGNFILYRIFRYSWFIHIMFYVIRILPDSEDKEKFVSDLVGKWQAYLETLFEDYDPISASDSGMCVCTCVC